MRVSSSDGTCSGLRGGDDAGGHLRILIGQFALQSLARLLPALRSSLSLLTCSASADMRAK